MNANQNGMSIKMECNSKLNVTQHGICKLDSNHWTQGCTVDMGLEQWERSTSKQFFCSRN